jgi:hypothetical protein
MIIEYTYSTYELKKSRCFNCKHLRMIDNWSGHCECTTNKVKIRNRQITDKKCSSKINNSENL